MADDRNETPEAPESREHATESQRRSEPESADIQSSRDSLADAAGQLMDDVGGQEGGEVPAVVLSVPMVKIDELNVKVEDLQVRVSLQAKLANLLHLDIGTGAHLGNLELELKGVEVQTLLTVRLRTVKDILDRVLTTIDNNPDVLKSVVEPIGETAEEVGQGVGNATEEVGQGGGEATEQATRDVAQVASETADEASAGIDRIEEATRKTAKSLSGKRV
jgi:hypothetical protein